MSEYGVAFDDYIQETEYDPDTIVESILQFRDMAVRVGEMRADIGAMTPGSPYMNLKQKMVAVLDEMYNAMMILASTDSDADGMISPDEVLAAKNAASELVPVIQESINSFSAEAARLTTELVGSQPIEPGETEEIVETEENKTNHFESGLGIVRLSLAIIFLSIGRKRNRT